MTSTVKTSTSTTTTQSAFLSLLLNKPQCGCEVIVLNHVQSKKKAERLIIIIWTNTLLKSAPPRLHNWQSDKLVIMLWNEQWWWVDWRADAGATPSLTLSALQAAVVSHGAEELEDEDGDSHDRQAHHKHHHPHRWAVGLCNTPAHTHKNENFRKFSWHLLITTS